MTFCRKSHILNGSKSILLRILSVASQSLEKVMFAASFQGMKDSQMFYQ